MNSKKDISRETLQVLRTIENRGVNLAVATGRAGYEAKFHARNISDRVFYIASNGSLVGSMAEDRVLSESSMKKENVRKLIEISEEVGVHPIFFTAHQTIISQFKEYLWHLLFNIKKSLTYIPRCRFIPNQQKFIEYVSRKDVLVSKAIFMVPDAGKAALFQKKLKDSGCFALTLYSDVYHEVNEKGINKSHGIRILMEHLNIHPEEIMAFGDNENDREMLSFVGCGIAMGNAVDTIKEIADTVTDTNDNDGVARVLKEVYTLS